jgi:endoglucanase
MISSFMNKKSLTVWILSLFFTFLFPIVSGNIGRAQSGSLIKISCGQKVEINDPCTAVYYYNMHGERQAFPNEQVFYSWYTDFSRVQIISSSAMATIPLAKSVTYKPGVTMVKFPSVPTVYAVSTGGVLRPIASESLARALYGTDWNTKIDDLSEAFFSHYTIGDAITAASDYNPNFVAASVEDIDQGAVDVVEESIFSGMSFYVDPSSSAQKQVAAWRVSRPVDAALLQIIADQPVGRWFGDWNTNVQSDVERYVTTVTNAGALPVLVAYNIPNRDCGSYSAGGSLDDDAYRAWVEDFATGIGSREAIVVLEPDATATSCVTNERLALLGEAVEMFKTKSQAIVYIDAGHENWINAPTMRDRLERANIATADGFALNVSNFYTTEENEAYGEELSELLGHKHFIIDTSRNGNGWNGEWCNPFGRKIGAFPSTDTGNPLVDAWLWVKPPGESDGTCNGGPEAGDWWAEYALDLVE